MNNLENDFPVFRTDYLNCRICLELAIEAIETSCCHNVYCDSCIMNIKNARKACPSCRKEKFDICTSHLARRMINTLPAQCPYGCENPLTKGDLEQHTMKCVKGPHHALYQANIYKKGLFSGYCKQFLFFKFSMEGTFTIMKNGKITICSNDRDGTADWEGTIDFNSFIIRLTKQYRHGYAVFYNGKMNRGLTEAKGKWSNDNYTENGSDFKLIFTEQVDR